jgi:hypothetical protein
LLADNPPLLWGAPGRSQAACAARRKSGNSGYLIMESVMRRLHGTVATLPCLLLVARLDVDLARRSSALCR